MLIGCHDADVSQLPVSADDAKSQLITRKCRCSVVAGSQVRVNDDIRFCILL